MSWLRSENIKPSEYDPQRSVDSFVAEYGEIGKQILECFNFVDPFQVFFEENVDEYLGYAKRFMEKLGKRNFTDLTQKEIAELVKSSFHQNQIGKFVTEAALEELTRQINLIRKSDISDSEKEDVSQNNNLLKNSL